MTHMIITKAVFIDDNLMYQYLDVAGKTIIPALKSQKCKNFIWLLICRAFHVNNLREILDYPFTPFICGDNLKPISKKGHVSDISFILPDLKRYIIKNKGVIQTRHDIDDWMSPDYVKDLQDIYFRNIKKYRRFIVNSQPVSCDFQGNTYPVRQYNKKTVSMHYTLCQNNVEYIVHDLPHHAMSKVAPVIATLKGYTKLIKHDCNIRDRHTNEIIDKI